MPFAAAMGIGQLVAPLLGGLFGGAPQFEDLPKNLQDTSNMSRDALQQSQDLRQRYLDRSDELRGMDKKNARGIGAFDPTSFGPGFDFLSAQQNQFRNADFAANPIRAALQRDQIPLQAAQAIGSLSPSLELGIANILGQSAAGAGAGMGGALGNAFGILGNQSTLGQGLGGFLGSLGGEQLLNAPPARNISGLMNMSPGVTNGMSGFMQRLLQGLPPVIGGE